MFNGEIIKLSKKLCLIWSSGLSSFAGSIVNPATPEFLNWTFLPLNLDTSFVVKKGCKSNMKNRMSNNVDPDEAVHY